MKIFCFTTHSYDETSWSLSHWFLDWWRWPQVYVPWQEVF